MCLGCTTKSILKGPLSIQYARKPYQPKCLQSFSCLFRLFFFLLFSPYYCSPLICLLFFFFSSSVSWLIIHLPQVPATLPPIFFFFLIHFFIFFSINLTLLHTHSAPLSPSFFFFFEKPLPFSWERKKESLFRNQKTPRVVLQFCVFIVFFGINDNNLILHIYIIIRKYYHTYFELIHTFYIWFCNNVE